MFIKRGETNWKYILILLILAAIVGGGILTWQYFETLRREFNVPEVGSPKTELFEEVSPVEEMSPAIRITKELEIKFSENYLTIINGVSRIQPGSFYYYEIDNNTKILFKKPEQALINSKEFDKGEVILKIGGEEFTLIEETSLTGPGGESFSVYLTDVPTIVLIKAAAGDMGWWIRDEHYLDLKRKEIVFIAKTAAGYGLEVVKKGLEPQVIDLKIDDQCGIFEERTGRKARVIDITLNSKPAGILKTPKEINCIDPGGIGPIYEPEPTLEKLGIASDFSKLFFSFKGTTWQNGKAKEVWREDFYINLTDDSNVKILRNLDNS